MNTHTLAIFGQLGGWEILLLAILGLLIFGRRLPEVGKSLGQGIVQFKKGLQGVEDEIDKSTAADTPTGIEDGSSLDDDIDHAIDAGEKEHSKQEA